MPKNVDFEATLSATGHLLDQRILSLPTSGLDAQHQRSHVGGGIVEMRVTPTPRDDGEAFPRQTFPLGSYMCAVVESWPSGHIEFLWIGPKGYASPTLATVACLPHFESIVKQRSS